MFRYLALIWDTTDSKQIEGALHIADRLRASSQSWVEAFHGEGLHVFCADIRPGSAQPYPMHNRAGIVLGALFEKPSDERAGVPKRAVLGEAASVRLIRSQGRDLADAYWGRYVAFLCDHTSGTRYVLCDPTGQMPCLSAKWRGIHCFFSAAADYRELTLGRLSINRAAIAYYLLDSQRPARATGLNEIGRVMAGECLEICADRVERHLYWHPQKFAQNDLIEDVEQATAALRTATRSCVHAWASCFDSIMHRLSGGIDSSIVLSCLRDAPTPLQLTCVNYYGTGADEDERYFARLAARSAGVELIERARNAELRLTELALLQQTDIPNATIGTLELWRSEAALAKQRQARAYFTGNGGDQIFFSHPYTAAASDCLRAHGFGSRFLSVALDAAYASRVSIWSVIRETLIKRTWDPFDHQWKHLKLLKPEVHREVDTSQMLHPWFLEPSDMPLGKLWHAYVIATPSPLYDPAQQPGDPEPLDPLISQPLIEVCLRIPTYILIHEGLDRAIARRAFSNEVPEEILKRIAKGGMDVHVDEVVARNADYIRELLLDGSLVAMGLLNREKTELALNPEAPDSGALSSELLTYVVTEMWINHWQSDPHNTGLLQGQQCA